MQRHQRCRKGTDDSRSEGGSFHGAAPPVLFDLGDFIDDYAIDPDLRNDLGLLAEEYDVRAGRQVGNFPQAFSHVALVNTALNLGFAAKPAEQRAEREAVA